MKRLVVVLALVVGVGAGGASSARAADSNVGVQLASISQTALASAPAVQFGGGFFSINRNSSYASATNYASISQWQAQFNR